MAIDKMKMKILNSLFDKGICDEKAVAAIGLKEAVELKFGYIENAELYQLQNAVKKNKVIEYLAGMQEESVQNG